jgi:hypothetical protein
MLFRLLATNQRTSQEPMRAGTRAPNRSLAERLESGRDCTISHMSQIELLAVVVASLHRSVTLDTFRQDWTTAVDGDPARGSRRPLGVAVGGRDAKDLRMSL